MKILTTLFFMLLCIPVFAQERTETVTTQLQCGDKEFAVKQITDLNLACLARISNSFLKIKHL